MYINITSLNRETEWREYMTTKKQNIAVIAVFLCMVFGMTIWTMVTPSREFSERENRALAQMPEASVESFSGKFEKDFETYLTDQFPMRDGWISAKTAIEKATFKTESKDIYFADDDYLIEAHSKSFTAPSANANIGYLKNFMETCVETYGKDHATAMVVPNAVDILRDHLPKYEVFCVSIRIFSFITAQTTTGPRKQHIMCMRHGQKKRDFLRLHCLIIKRRRSQMDSSARLMPRSADATAAIRSMFIFRRKRKNIR